MSISSLSFLVKFFKTGVKSLSSEKVKILRKTLLGLMFLIAF